MKRTRFSLILIQHVLTSVPIPITTRCGPLSTIRSHPEIPHATVSGLIYSRENKATLPNCLPQKPGPGREGHSIRPIATFSEMKPAPQPECGDLDLRACWKTGWHCRDEGFNWKLSELICRAFKGHISLGSSILHLIEHSGWSGDPVIIFGLTSK